jgi:hypothetical protein
MTRMNNLAKRKWVTVALTLATICAPALAVVPPLLPGAYIVEFVDGYGDAVGFSSSPIGFTEANYMVTLEVRLLWQPHGL